MRYARPFDQRGITDDVHTPIEDGHTQTRANAIPYETPHHRRTQEENHESIIGDGKRHV